MLVQGLEYVGEQCPELVGVLGQRADVAGGGDDPAGGLVAAAVSDPVARHSPYGGAQLVHVRACRFFGTGEDAERLTHPQVEAGLVGRLQRAVVGAGRGAYLASIVWTASSTALWMSEAVGFQSVSSMRGHRT